MDEYGNFQRLDGSFQDITQEKEDLKRIEHLNSVLLAIRNVNQLITQVYDPDLLLEQCCDILTGTRGYYNAWIAVFDKEKRFVSAYESGLGDSFIPMLKLLKRDDITSCGKEVLKTGKIVTHMNPAESCRDCPLSSEYNDRGAMTVRLFYGDHVYGILSVSVPAEYVRDKEEQRLLMEVAGDIAFALHSIEIENLRTDAERQVYEKKEEITALLNSIPDAVFFRDAKGKYVLFNERTEEILGLDSEYIIGKTVADLLPPDFVCECEKSDEAVIKTGETVAIEEFLTLSDGSRHMYETIKSPINDDNGQIRGILGISRDITSRKEAEDAIAAEKERLSVTLRSIGDGVIVTDSSGNVTLLNSVAEKLTGWKEHEAVGRSLTDVFHIVNEKTRELSENPAEKVLMSGEIVALSNHTALISRKGTEYSIADSAAPVRDREGSIIGVVLVFRDVTEEKKAQSELLRLAAIVDSSDDSIIGKHTDGTILSWNLGAEKITGYSADEVVGKNISMLLPPERQNEFSEIMDRITAGEHIDHFETVRIKKDKKPIDVSLTVSPIMDESGVFIGVSTIGRDITEKKQADAKIKAAHKRLEEIIDFLPDPTFVTDKEGVVIEWNKSMEAMTGISKSDAIGTTRPMYSKSLYDIERPLLFEFVLGKRDDLSDWYPDAVQNGLSLEAEVDLLTLNNGKGGVVWVRASPFYDEFRNIAGAIESIYDITEKKEAEKALHLTQFSVDHSPEEVYWIAEDGHFLYVNEQACSELGYTKEELFSMNTFDVDPDFDPEMWKPHWEDIKLKKHVDIETRHQRKDGSIYPAAVSAEYLNFNDVEFNCANVRNITENKKNEEKLLRSNLELQQFAYVASHDLQEPLRAITGFVQLLDEEYRDKFDENGEEYLNFIVDGADRMRVLIEDLLKYARVQSRGKEFEPTDLNDLIDRVRLNLKNVMDETGTTLEVGKLPVLSVDSTQILQLFQNLISNSIKFRSDDRPYIRIFSEKITGGWKFGVSDNGIGISPEYHERIFKIFQRLHSRQKYEGTGIGLAVCSRIVQRHNGNIWVESKKEGGSTFFFTIADDIS